MATKCNCIDDTRGFIITGVITIIAVLLYAALIAVFYLRGLTDFAMAVIYTLFALDLLTVTFQAIFFAV